MTKYYVGYVQGNDEYVYVASIDNSNVRVSTITEGAMGFDTKELAESLKNIADATVLNQTYKILEIKTEIKEVK